MRALLATWITLLLIGIGSAMAEPMGTGFTYQGELQNTGVAIDGQVEFEFEPFDAVSGGSSLASTVIQTLMLNGGIFSTELDFGSLPFTGEAVWLEVRVREDSGSFTTLSPRQAITPAPYALHAQSVAMDAVTTREIADGSILSADLASGSVGDAQIDPAQVQRRVSSTCPSGSAIREVAVDGSVTCQLSEDDDWLPLGDGRLQNTTGIRVQPVAGTLYPLTIRHDSGINSPTIALVESQQDYARLSFYADPNPSFWTIAAASAADTDEDIMNFYNSAVGDIMTIRGNRRIGIRNINPQATLHVSGGDVRVDALAHAGPDSTPVWVQPDGTLIPEPAEGTAPDKYLTLGPSAFRATDSTVETRLFRSLIFPTGITGTLQAPILLPDGMVLQEIIVHFLDNSAANDLNVMLLAGGLGGNSAAVMRDLTSGGFNSDYRTISEAITSGSRTINNLDNHYYLSITGTPAWTGDQELGLQAVTLRYR